MITLQKLSLGDIADVIRGVTFSRADGESTGSELTVPVIRAGNVQDRLLLNDDLVWVPKGKVSKKQFIKKDDLIMCTSSGSADIVGKCARAESDWEGSFGAFCAGIRAKKKICEPGYLFHFLRSSAFRNWSKKSGGANIKNIRKSELEEFEIPLPPLPEQRRIAAILDKADAIRRKRQQSIRLTEDFLRSVFLDMFGDPVTNPKGWEVVALGDVCDFTAGNSLPQGEPYIEQNDGHLLLKVGDMNLPGNEIFISTAREWTGSYRGRMIAPKGAIVLPKRGGAISTNKKRMLTRPALLDPNLMGIYSREGQINSYCLFQWFQGFDLNEISSGSAVPQLNKQDLAPLKIALPPKPLQEKFENNVKKVFVIKDLQKSRGYEDLFNSLVQRAFRGDL